jgi:DNA integrity scanning protein DisA with diadenylate cyclase activity
MWKVRTKIVPVIIGTLAKIKNIFDQNLQLLPAIELQKVTIMNNVYSTRYALG